MVVQDQFGEMGVNESKGEDLLLYAASFLHCTKVTYQRREDI